MSPLEVLGAELGAIAAQIGKETSLRLDAALSDLKRQTAEWELRFDRLERAVAERLSAVKDGASVTVADVTPLVEETVRAALPSAVEGVRAGLSAEIAEKVAALPKAKDGDDADPAAVAEALRSALRSDVEAMIAERVAQIQMPAATVDRDALAEAAREAVAALPAPERGKDADPDDVARALAELMTQSVDEMIASRVAQIPAPTIDEAALASAAERAVAALPAPKDGVDVDMDVVRALIGDEVAKAPAPKDGRTPTAEEIAPLVDKAVADAVSALPPPVAGKDADMDAVRQFIREEVANIPVPKDGETPSDERLREIAGPIIAETVAALPPAQPGKDADPAEIRRMVEEAVSAIPVPKDGETPTSEAIRGVVDQVVKAAMEALPKPKDGEDGTSVDPEQVRAMVEEAVAAIPKPQDGKDGRLPVVKAWADRVYYEGEVCSHDGATYQASVDTGRAPPHADWTCIAAKGRDGIDADQIKIDGTFDPEKQYGRLAIVQLNGASFIAKKDDPGPCPGEGWQLMAQQGKRGGPGLVTKADRGTRPVDMSITADGVLTLKMDDGGEVECDLYPLLSRL